MVIFHRPGREIYLRHKSYDPSSGSRDRANRVGRITAPISDSTTAIRHVDDGGSWIELGSTQHSFHNNDGIRQTLEVDVTSHRKKMGSEGKEVSPITEGNGMR